VTSQTPVAHGAPLLSLAEQRYLERLSLAVRKVGHQLGARAGQRRTPAADYVDRRPYSPGDDRRHIDWHAAARHAEVLVKIGRAPQATDLHLIIDRSPSLWRWPGRWRQLKRVAAALGWMALSQGDRLGASLAPEDPAASWQPRRGASQAGAWLAWLAALDGAACERSELGPTMRSWRRLAGSGGLLVLLTDGWLDEDIEALLQVPAGRWTVLLCCLQGPADSLPPAMGAQTLQDSESGALLDVNLDSGQVEAYNTRLAARSEGLRAIAAARGHRSLVVLEDDSLEAAVLPFLDLRLASRR